MDHARIVLRKFQIERHGSQQLHVAGLQEFDEVQSTFMDASDSRAAPVID
jgi:hypothetical protein